MAPSRDVTSCLGRARLARRRVRSGAAAGDWALGVRGLDRGEARAGERLPRGLGQREARAAEGLQTDGRHFRFGAPDGRKRGSPRERCGVGVPEG